MLNSVAQTFYQVSLNSGLVSACFSVTLAPRQRAWCTGGKRGERAVWWVTATQLPKTTVSAKSAAPPGDLMATGVLLNKQKTIQGRAASKIGQVLSIEGWRARGSLGGVTQLARGDTLLPWSCSKLKIKILGIFKKKMNFLHYLINSFITFSSCLFNRESIFLMGDMGYFNCSL